MDSGKLLSGLLHNPDWIWRVIITVILCAQLWLQKNYVARADYDKDRAALAVSLESITAYMIDLKIEHNGFTANRQIIHDHEQRLRTLESKR